VHDSDGSNPSVTVVVRADVLVVLVVLAVLVVLDVGCTEPDEPEPDASKLHTSLTLLQQSFLIPQNSSQKQAGIVVPGWSTLPPQSSTQDSHGVNTSVMGCGRTVVCPPDPDTPDPPDPPDKPDPPDTPEPSAFSGMVVVLEVLSTTSTPLTSTRTKLFRMPDVSQGAVYTTIKYFELISSAIIGFRSTTTVPELPSSGTESKP